MIGSFLVNLPDLERRPLSDMTELNAASWMAWADGATASTADDMSRKVLGDASVRFDTTGGFDTYLRYAPASGAEWDLTDATEFHFSIYAENPSPFGFQQEPIVHLMDVDGNVRELRYWQDENPYVLWNNARDQWLDVSIPIKSDAQPATGWRSVNPGTFDWSRIKSVEIHADTWDAGFTLWIDRAGFNLPIKVSSASFEQTDSGHQVALEFDAPSLTFPATIQPTIQNLLNGVFIPNGNINITPQSSPGGSSSYRLDFAGYANGLLPDGAYRLTLPVDSVVDAAGNTLTSAFTLDFSTLQGDYIADGRVDQADYSFWKLHFGATSGQGLQADGNRDGVVNAADYTVWRNNLGTVAPEAGGGQGSALAAVAADTTDESGQRAVGDALTESLISVISESAVQSLPIAVDERVAIGEAQTRRPMDLRRQITSAMTRQSLSHGVSQHIAAARQSTVVRGQRLPSFDAYFAEHQLPLNRMSDHLPQIRLELNDRQTNLVRHDAKGVQRSPNLEDALVSTAEEASVTALDEVFANELTWK